MRIRPATPDDLPALAELTIAAFRPLFEEHLPAASDPAVFAHDHADWQRRYRDDVPALLAPDDGRHITLAEGDDGVPLGFVAWHLTPPDTGVLELLATAPAARGTGVATALCDDVLGRLRAHGATVVHVGTGGDDFHAAARRLYERLGFIGIPGVHYHRAL